MPDPGAALGRLIAANLATNVLLVVVMVSAPSLTYGATAGVLQLAACIGVALNVMFAVVRLRMLLFGPLG
jgi:hypothetical protein